MSYLELTFNNIKMAEVTNYNDVIVFMKSENVTF